MDSLSFANLPDLPQCRQIPALAESLWQGAGVLALWIGGSLASGKADEYSDIDLRIGVEPEALEAWKSPDWDTLFPLRVVGHQFLTFGDAAFLHHLVLEDGAIYDVWVQPVTQPPSAEAVLVLGCREAAFAELLHGLPPLEGLTFETPCPESVRQALVDYWILTHKHRKVLHRDLNLLAITGIEIERLVLLRLWFIAATGQDYAMRHKSIFGLTHLTRVVETTYGERALQVLGASLAGRTELCRAIEQIRDAVSEVGRELAKRLDFVYPAELERTARQGWDYFMERAQAG